ncbi:nephrin-like isoform X3 [Atheta coriaria]|uniref:nephrin-like isoform X3 n=1 Tax=Dalotia coriaria TaxID=877792 RepID=UPI0031F361BA
MCFVVVVCAQRVRWRESCRLPPQGIQVSDDHGPIKNGITSAYAEGASLTLTCSASSGKPLPRVSWWRDGEQISDETQYFAERKKSQNVLKINKLLRTHLLAVFSCEVSNSQLQPPLVVRVAVDMYLRPLESRLQGDNQPLSAGRRTDITCKCKGSRPPAVITWWKDGMSLEGGSVAVSADGNTTTSTLTFTPTASDHGLLLTCRASNHRIPLSELRDTWMLRVLYPPKVTLTLGHGLDANDIKEGADVYFECHLVANPWVLRVWWLRDGQRLLSNATSGVIVSNQTLVLQGVSRTSSGRYCCEASNTEGSSKSASFHLKVKYEPVCGDMSGRKVLGAAKDEPLTVECKVEAEPAAQLFRWSFNSTPGISKELTEFTAEPGGSQLTYTPKVAADYGTLQCWGRNELGSQRMPCTYHIVPAGKPDPPNMCAFANITHHSTVFVCKKGFDGGMRQKFALLVTAADALIANLSASAPEFLISNLEPAQDYIATIYSINAKGWSKASNPLSVRTLPAPGLKERRYTGPVGEDKSSGGGGPWLYIVLAAGATLIVAGAIGAIIIAVRRFKVDSPVHDRRQRSPKREEIPLNPGASTFTTDTSLNDDKNPDLIPPSNESLLDCSAPYTITARPSTKRNSATQMPVKPYHVTWAPILQSRNCATQTPPPHKESSV